MMTQTFRSEHHKPCIGCGESKPLNEFYSHPMMADGHLNRCKPCCKAAARTNREAKPAQYQMHGLLRAQHPERKAQVAAYNRRRRERDPEKYRARTAVGNAVRDGRLKRQPCKCGATKVQAHHHDYSKPLDVVWLCFGCHRREHGQRPFF